MIPSVSVRGNSYLPIIGSSTNSKAFGRLCIMAKKVTTNATSCVCLRLKWAKRKRNLKQLTLAQIPHRLRASTKWRLIATCGNQSKLRIGIELCRTCNADRYFAYYLDGGAYPNDWKEGEKIGEIRVLGTNDRFTANWVLPNKIIDFDAQIIRDEDNSIRLINTLPEYNETSFLKLSPIQNLALLQELSNRFIGYGSCH